MDILGLDGDTFSVDSSQVGIFEKTNEESFRGFLESTDGRRLETQVGFEVLSNFTNQTLEGEFADQEFGRLLITTNFTKSDGTGSVTMGLFIIIRERLWSL